MADIRNILLIRPSALGDVCRSVPMLAGLRRAYPDARIDWLVQREFTDAIWHHPGLSEAVPFDRRGIGRALARGNPGPLFSLIGRLRRARYDLVVDAQGLARSGFLARATGARRRIGFAAPEAREAAWIWYTQRVPVLGCAHAVERMMSLAQAAGAASVNACGEPERDMRLYTGPAERAWAQGAVAGARRYVVLAPTSRWAGKRWPAERYAGLARALLDAGAERIVVVGGGSERDQCAPLLTLAQDDARVSDFVGRTTVGQLMALVQGAALVVANDSAALHMAVGFDRPLVALYGPTYISQVGPYRREGDAIQHVQAGEVLDHKNDAAGRALMERITLDEVVEAALRRLSTPIEAQAR